MSSLAANPATTASTTPPYAAPKEATATPSSRKVTPNGFMASKVDELKTKISTLSPPQESLGKM